MADIPPHWGSPQVLVLPFNTSTVTKPIYDQFIDDCILTLSTGEAHLDFPSLPYQTPIEFQLINHFFIRLSNGDDDVTYVGRRKDLYLIAFANPNGVFFFSDISPILMRLLFPHDPLFPANTLPLFPLQFPGTYSLLQTKGLGSLSHRCDYPLSFDQLDKSIRNLFYLENTDKKKDAAIGKGFLLTIQMFCEAIRLRNFKIGVGGVAGRYEYFEVTPHDARASERWGRMSSAVLAANDPQDQFPIPIELIPGQAQHNVGSVAQARDYLQTLKRAQE